MVLLLNRDYRVIDANKLSSAETIQEISQMVQQVFNDNITLPHQGIITKNFLMIRGTFSEESIITVKPPKREKKDVIKTFPEECQKELEAVAKELKLNNTQLRKLNSKLGKMDSRLKSAEEKITYLKEQALEIREQADIEKMINNFERSYSKFNECLNSGLLELSSEQKNEIHIRLSDLLEVIKQVQTNYLK